MIERKGVVAGAIGVALAAAIAFVHPWEGTEYKAYADFAGGPTTICRGHTRGVKMGDTATEAQCQQWDREDMAEANAIVDHCIHVALRANERAAFLSAAENIGPKVLCGSTLQRKANDGDVEGACNELLRWDMAGGRHYPGLRQRRIAERRLCLLPDPTIPAT